jgi:hypothetical protein
MHSIDHAVALELNPNAVHPCAREDEIEPQVWAIGVALILVCVGIVCF